MLRKDRTTTRISRQLLLCITILLIISFGWNDLSAYSSADVYVTHCNEADLKRMSAPDVTEISDTLVQFQVQEAADYTGSRHVTGGVPLNRNVLESEDLESLQLLDESGETVDFSPTITARWSWPDGSVQWLLLDFTEYFEAGKNRRFTLVQGASKDSTESDLLHVRETQQAIEINTGEIEFSVSRRQFSFLSGVTHAETSMTSEAGGDLVVDMLQAVPDKTDEENWLRSAPQGDIARLSARAGQDYRAEIEFLNDRRAVIKLTGTLSPAPESIGRTDATFPYTVRLTVRAGDSRVHVQPTLLYNGDVEKETIRRIGLSVPLAGKEMPLKARAAGQGDDPLAIEPDRPDRPSHQDRTGNIGLDVAEEQTLSLLSVGPKKHFHDAPRYEMARIDYRIDHVEDGGNATTIGRGDSSQGWIAAGDGKRTVYAALRDFWRLHPKELSVEGSDRAVHIWLWPDRGDVVLDGRRHSERKVYEEYRDGEGWRYEGEDQDIGYFYGRAISNELEIDFSTTGIDSQHADRLAAGLNEPLYLLADPEYYRKNEVVGPIAPYDPDRYPRIEGIQDLFLEWLIRNQKNYGWYGMIDYGDVLMEYDWFHVRHWGEQREGWLNRGYSGWLNNDGQVDHALYLHALRKSDRELFRFAEAMTRHVGEIDTPHLEMEMSDELEVGINDNMGRPRVGGVVVRKNWTAKLENLICCHEKKKKTFRSQIQNKGSAGGA